MANNQSGAESKGVCEKLYSAIAATGKIRRFSRGQQKSSPQLPTHDQSGSGKEIIIESDAPRAIEVEKSKPETKLGSSQETKATSEPIISTPSRKQITTPPPPPVEGEKNSLETVQEGQTNKGEGHHKVGDHKFSDYITKVKKMLRASSNVGNSKIEVNRRRDSFNDKVSNYINSAKFKIRTTTTLGAAGKTLSSK